jgi:outer membrane protein
MKKIFLIPVLFAAVSSLLGQVNRTNELQQLVNTSFTYFPGVKEVQNTITTAKQQLEIASNNLPRVDANASYTYVRPKIVLPLEINGKTQEFQFAPINNVNANVTGSYTLFDFGRLKANIEKAKEDIRYAEHNTEYARYQLAGQVAAIYYNIIFYRRGIAIEDSVIAYLDDNKSIVESKLKNGDAIRLDLLNIQAQEDAETNRKIDLQTALVKQINLLRFSTGSGEVTGTGFDFTVPADVLGDALAAARTANPAFLLAADRVQQAKDQQAIARLGTRPSLNIGAGTGFKNGYVPDVNALKFNYEAGVSIKVPIYDGNRTKQQVKLAESVLSQQQLATETLNSTYTRDIQQALVDIHSGEERIHHTAGQIDQAVQAENIAASRFKNGVGTNLEITAASTAVARAQFTRLQYEYQLCLAKVELARLAGYKFW